MKSPLLRAILAMLLFTAWLALLFAGLAAGAAVHLLLVGAVAVFPWRALRGQVAEEDNELGPLIGLDIRNRNVRGKGGAVLALRLDHRG